MREQAAKARKPTKTGGKEKRRTQADRRSESDRRLIAAAFKLIAAKGADRTSLGEVGIAAGYSRGLPGERFGSKLHFLEAIVDQMEHYFEARVAETVGDKKGLAAVMALIDTHFDGAYYTPEATKALEQLYMDALGALPELKPRMVRFRHGLMDRFAREIRIGQKTGEIRADINAKNAARIVETSMIGIVQQAFFDGDVKHLKTLRKDFTEQVRRYLEP